MKIGIISLGCSKNLVDTETFLGVLNTPNNEFVDKVPDADLILINTCGFIESAKQEAIDTIFKVLKEKKDDAKVIVTGCLAQRYKKDLENLIPEVDRFISIDEYGRFSEIVDEVTGNETTTKMPLSCMNRVLTTPDHLAYVKISDGCNNKCHYCAIPLIRGEFKSRPKDEIIAEVIQLVRQGYKEIVLISQDTTRYGSDIYKDYTTASLLQDLEKISDLYMIRLLYMYPDEITDELIDTIKNSKKIAHYFDIPVQHASSKVLASMNRRSNKELIYKVCNKIRQRVPDAILRTTVIVGYPTEEEKDFQELLDMAADLRFDRLGAFIFSSEEGTEAYRLYPDLIDKEICEERMNRLMDLQKKVSLESNRAKIGNTYPVIVEDYNFKQKMYKSRSYMNAPDDVDGYIYFKSHKVLTVGDIVNVKIESAGEYDLFGEIEG